MTLNVMLWHWGRAGAGCKFTLELAAHLAQRGAIRPHLSLTHESGCIGQAEGLGLPGFHVHTFRGEKTRLGGILSAAAQVPRFAVVGPRFAAHVRRSGIDLVLCTMNTIWHAAALSPLRRSGSRFAMILHDAAPHPGDEYPLRYYFLKRQIKGSDGLIVLSDHVAQQARTLHAYPQDRIWRIEHGAFDYGVGQEGPRSISGDRPLRLLLFGRLVAYKGLDLLLDTYEALRRAGAPVVLGIAGSGDLGPYQDRLARLGDVSVTNRWIADEEVAGFLKEADLLVLPYTEASQSGVIAAAFAAGIPAVVTPVGGLSEQVAHERTGLVADGMAPTDVARAIMRFVAEPGLYEACSAGALNQARTELSWDRVAARVEAACQRIVDLPPRSATSRSGRAASEVRPKRAAAETERL